MAAKKKAAKGSRKKATKKVAPKKKATLKRKKTAGRTPHAGKGFWNAGAAFEDADLPGDEGTEND